MLFIQLMALQWCQKQRWQQTLIWWVTSPLQLLNGLFGANWCFSSACHSTAVHDAAFDHSSDAIWRCAYKTAKQGFLQLCFTGASRHSLYICYTAVRCCRACYISSKTTVACHQVLWLARSSKSKLSLAAFQVCNLTIGHHTAVRCCRACLSSLTTTAAMQSGVVAYKTAMECGTPRDGPSSNGCKAGL